MRLSFGNDVGLKHILKSISTEPADLEKHSLSGIQCKTEIRQLAWPKRHTASISEQNESYSIGEKLQKCIVLSRTDLDRHQENA